LQNEDQKKAKKGDDEDIKILNENHSGSGKILVLKIPDSCKLP
jgi:hypothetical protein